MSDDFFGGILDDMRGVVTDANSFFNHTTNPDANPLGKAAAYGLAYGTKPQNDPRKLSEAYYLSKENNVADNHNPATPGYAPSRNLDKSNENRSVNFEQDEQSWLLRLRRFSQIDSELQSGKVNEGKPQ